MCLLSGPPKLSINYRTAVWFLIDIVHTVLSCVRLSPTTVNQNTRHILCLGSAIGKGFNTHFLSSLTTRPKREPFLQMRLQERGYSNLGYTSPNTQNESFI
jgi:hypothetical protein